MSCQWLSLVVAMLLAAPTASAVTIDWVAVGGVGNVGDTEVMNDGTTGYGSVGYVYRISKTEVTNSQYAEFLNAVYPSGGGPLGLYDTRMASQAIGGIWRFNSRPDGSKFVPKPTMATKPVNYVSFWDSLRFANWLHNGQGSGDTETGAYTLRGGTASPSNGVNVTRNAGATIFLTSEDEWYKAAYYDVESSTYFDYPAGIDAQTGCVAPASDTGNSTNCDDVVDVPTDVGAYSLSASPNGTFDQGGNAWEWNETKLVGGDRGLRGGSWDNVLGALAASHRNDIDPTDKAGTVGFRVASIPEPGTGALLMTGVLGLAASHRRRVA